MDRGFYMMIAEVGADPTDRATNYKNLQDVDGAGSVTLTVPSDPTIQYE